ncbi:MAG: LysR family transcriptional regulator [Rhodoferax sp.]|uniref:LysR family transcriptional regulator n=1 Tax=Rhodoferax sp. TaxID=50421 RepID=UPI00140111F7|nr:LysR family transcriptional regulator [Rhodoferax sp.]NDP40963.1 LysR family transcriptional regulator [Rhodoferax sp.]
MFNWEDLRHFLAVARTGTLSGAARDLKVDHATVSRRLVALEDDLQVRLVERMPRACRLTAIGQTISELAQSIEENAFAIDRAIRANQSPLSGKVTLSAPPVLVASFLAKYLADFRQRHPGIQLSVSGQAQQVSLSRREADLAIRLVRPKESTNVVRRLGTMPFALYASGDYANLERPSAWEFIAYDAQFDDMPQQQWLRRIAGERPIACEISDINGHHAAARAKAGVAGLPCFLGDADPSLQRLTYDGDPFARDIWLVVHRDLKRASPIRAVMDFLIETVESDPAFRSKGR